MRLSDYIQFLQSAELFNVTHFRTKTKTTRILMRDLLFADDSALVAHSAEEMQKIIIIIRTFIKCHKSRSIHSEALYMRYIDAVTLGNLK